MHLVYVHRHRRHIVILAAVGKRPAGFGVSGIGPVIVRKRIKYRRGVHAGFRIKRIRIRLKMLPCGRTYQEFVFFAVGKPVNARSPHASRALAGHRHALAPTVKIAGDIHLVRLRSPYAEVHAAVGLTVRAHIIVCPNVSALMKKILRV